MLRSHGCILISLRDDGPLIRILGFNCRGTGDFLNPFGVLGMYVSFLGQALALDVAARAVHALGISWLHKVLHSLPAERASEKKGRIITAWVGSTLDHPTRSQFVDESRVKVEELADA